MFNFLASASNDRDVQRELEQRPLNLPDGLKISWLGTAGYRLDYQGQTLLIDPYFSRVPLKNLLSRKRALPDRQQIDKYLPGVTNLAGVVLGHTHFDHAIDAPLIAKIYKSKVYGSASAANLMALHGLTDSAVQVVPHQVYELGPFEVTFVPSLHSKLIAGLAVPFAGELTCEHLDGLCPSAYRCGQVFAIHIKVNGFTIYHQGSADLIESEIKYRSVNLMLAGVAGRSVTTNYWSRILGAVEPDVLVPSHFDDFFRPLDQQQGFSRGVNLAAFPDEVKQVSGDISVASIPLLLTLDGSWLFA